MTGQSTAKMLARMHGKNEPECSEAVTKESVDVYSVPPLKPSSDMEHVLSNILGSSASKKYTPMDGA